MKIIRSYWFAGMSGYVGIVVGEDESTGKGKACIGSVLGLNEADDAKHVAQTGAKLSLSVLDEIRALMVPKPALEGKPGPFAGKGTVV